MTFITGSARESSPIDAAVVLTAIESITLAARFLLELCLLGAIGYWGFRAVPGRLAGVGAALVVAPLWGALLAPASEMRLQGVA
jgi:hypothetical protein